MELYNWYYLYLRFELLTRQNAIIDPHHLIQYENIVNLTF